MKIVASFLPNMLRQFKNISGELKYYYIFNFLRNLADVKGSYFLMAYFFFQGFSVSEIVLNLFVFAATALIITIPISKLMHHVGVKKTFLLHLLPVALNLFVILNISTERAWLFYLWMFTHAFTVMLQRIFCLGGVFFERLRQNKKYLQSPSG